MGINNPCYECKKRNIGCHSNCGEYSKWVEEIKEKHKRIFLRKEREEIASAYQIDKARRFSRKK